MVSAAARRMGSTDTPMESRAQGQWHLSAEGTLLWCQRSFWEHVLFLLNTRKLRFREGKALVCQSQRGDVCDQSLVPPDARPPSHGENWPLPAGAL